MRWRQATSGFRCSSGDVETWRRSSLLYLWGLVLLLLLLFTDVYWPCFVIKTYWVLNSWSSFLWYSLSLVVIDHIFLDRFKHIKNPVMLKWLAWLWSPFMTYLKKKDFSARKSVFTVIPACTLSLSLSPSVSPYLYQLEGSRVKTRFHLWIFGQIWCTSTQWQDATLQQLVCAARSPSKNVSRIKIVICRWCRPEKTMKSHQKSECWVEVGTMQMNDRNREIQTESKTYDGYLSYHIIIYIMYIY